MQRAEPGRERRPFRSIIILEKFPKSHGTTAERAFVHLCGVGGGLTGLPP